MDPTHRLELSIILPIYEEAESVEKLIPELVDRLSEGDDSGESD